jgi:cell division control protein 6
LAHLLGVKPRGCSLDELWAKLETAMPGKTVFVLDEADLLSDRDQHKEILYLLSRSPRNYMTILLSNNPKFMNVLDESIKSTLQPETVHFRNYNAEEVRAILTDRAEVGLRVTPEPAIAQISALTAKRTNSDVRVALRTLYLWAIEPQVPVEEHFEKARRDVMVDVVRDLNEQNLLILKAILARKDEFARDVYQVYRHISVVHHEEPFTYQYFYTNLSYLQSMGLILLVSTKVNRAYANRIQLTFDPGVFQSVWEAHFGADHD